jgi:phosphoglycolate phosphatase
LFEAAVYKGIPEMLTTLQTQGYHLLLATSKPHTYARQILAHFDLLPFFATVYGSEMNGRNAHKTDLIRHVLQQETLQPNKAAMIGDREHDILGAKANDVWAGGVLYGYGRVEDLHLAQPDHLFATPQAINQYFTQLQETS